MINPLNVTTGKPLNPARVFGFRINVLLIIAASAPVLAHGGFEHIRGIVVKVVNNVLTVKTDKGNVDVKLGNQTYLIRNDQKAQRTDLKFGARVVVDVHEGSNDKLAHSVQIGAITKPVDQYASR